MNGFRHTVIRSSFYHSGGPVNAPITTTTTLPATVDLGSVSNGTGYEFNVDDITTNLFTPPGGMPATSF